jgi:RNA polymerase sigma factor (sigma-70 family)
MLHAPNNDALIWQSFKDGDRTSFEKIYHLYFKSLYEYGVRLINDKEVVKDCIHDLFVKIWSNKDNLGEISNLKSYLLVSLRGTIYNKSQSNSKITFDEIDEKYDFRMDFSVENEYINKESSSGQSEKILQLLHSLTPRQKEVIYLKYFEELDYGEIAAILNISVKATYKLSARALDALREVLQLSHSSVLILFALMKAELFN